MALPFFDSGARKRLDQVLAVDLGSRVTKALLVQRQGDGFTVSASALLDAPIFEKTITADLLTEHLKVLAKAIPGKCKNLALTIGVNDAIVRPVEMPPMPPDDMRAILKNASRTYLQQELTGYVYDCYVLPAQQQAKPAESRAGGAPHKQKVLVAGAKQQLVDDLILGARNAGFIADTIHPTLIGPINAFEMVLPEIFHQEAVALVDIGFRSSSICLLQRGELIVTRTVAMGGDKVTAAISESMNISYAEAEGLKLGMPQEVQLPMETVLTPLSRELRASMDFFEHQQDTVIGQIFVSGGSARSQVVQQVLQAELMAECKLWNPLAKMKLEVPPERAAELEAVTSQLAAVVGAALAAL